MKKNVVFLTRSLEYGGAERQLVTLVKGMDKTYYNISVICFYCGGILENELDAVGIPVQCINKRGRWDVLPFLYKFFRLIKENNPKVLHGYLELSNILAVCCKIFIPGISVFLGIRASYMDLQQYDWLYTIVRKVEAILSKFADQIIVNSHAGKKICIQRGFPINKIMVIENGIDTNYFQRNEQKRMQLRAAWHIADNHILIGLVGRIDVMKDHPTFLKSVSIIKKSIDNVRFLCVGSGKMEYREEMMKLATQLDLDDRLIWAGTQSDMPAVYSALDILCSSSCGEGFSNVIGEAMSCSLPCVVTDVGDSAIIVGDYGLVVPPRNPDSLAATIIDIINKSPSVREQIGKSSRKRIEENYNIQMMVTKTTNVINHHMQTDKS